MIGIKNLIAVPEVLLDNFQRQEDGRWRFTMTINSVPTPQYVQWSIKNTSETFQPLNVNAEEYKGTSSLFPHPVLIIQHIERQKSCVFELEVKNRIGRATKQMQGKCYYYLHFFCSKGHNIIPFFYQKIDAIDKEDLYSPHKIMFCY